MESAGMSQTLTLCCNKDDDLKEMLCWIGGSSRPEVFYQKGILQNFAKFTGKLCQSLLFPKLQASLSNSKYQTYMVYFLMSF